MRIVEALNKYFGISSTISVPILVSLLIFIVGGLINFLVSSIKNYYRRLQIRKSFRNIITQVIIGCSLQSRHIREFYPTLTVKHKDDWNLKFTKNAYLEIAFRQEYTAVFAAFRCLVHYRLNREIRIKAFNEIWAILEKLKFIELQILDNLKGFINTLNNHKSSYDLLIEQLRKYQDNLRFSTNGMQVPVAQQPLYNYLMDQDRIWYSWTQIENRTHPSITYNNLVKPLYDLNIKNQGIPLTLDSNNILLPAMHEYDQMKKLLQVIHDMFYGYYQNFRISEKLLKKCRGMLK